MKKSNGKYEYQSKMMDSTGNGLHPGTQVKFKSATNMDLKYPDHELDTVYRIRAVYKPSAVSPSTHNVTLMTLSGESVGYVDPYDLEASTGDSQ